MSVTESKTEIFDMASTEAEDTARGRNNVVGIFERYVQPCLAELLGSTLFIFAGCCSVIGNAGISGSVQPALAHGLALAIAIVIFGEISGGHFNPAVSVSVYLVGGLEVILLAPYIIVQLCGGMIGAALAKLIFPDESFQFATGAAFNAVQTNATIGRATVAEMLMTLILTLVVCMGAINKRTRSPLAPFCIGLTVTANILAGGAVSGACMNPARAFGPAIAANYWTYHWIYWVGPLAGALLTVSFVRLLMGDQKTRLILK
ncbi:aquaporin-8a.1 [Alosa sapidissima]|uniref:aquaporin-8a.1 n=1 Tax=Alosa sapidissima TaxID=34773 RepID=UPI001C091AED|nr:aquaporin-8a.1 [Alosa sapidissima]